MKTPKISHLYRLKLGLGMLFCSLWLLGCALPTPTSRVTTFQQWPADTVNATWRFADINSDSLEHQQYLEQLRRSLGSAGLTESTNNARFEVNLSYTMNSELVVQQFFNAEPVFNDTSRTFRVTRPDGTVERHRVDSVGPPRMVNRVEHVTNTAFRTTVKITITEPARNNARVYESTAVYLGSIDSLPMVVPLLIQAIFDNFPDGNGMVRTVPLSVG